MFRPAGSWQTCVRGAYASRQKTLGLLFATTLVVQAQWLNYREPNIPRTKDGRPDLSAPAPRINGKPDLSGVWQAERTPASEYARVLGPDFLNMQVDASDVTKHAINVFWEVKPGEEPMRPEGAAILQERLKTNAAPKLCLPDSMPRTMLILTFKMIQAPREIAVVFENGNPPRQIFTDGRSLPEDPQPSWMGYSSAKWEGDTLVVETNGITDRSWLDIMGHPHSEKMRITERYRRRDFGHMDLEVTIDDPVYYTKPFGFKTALALIPDTDVLEYICLENERDQAHLR